MKDEYVIRECIEVAHSHDVVQLENKDSLISGFFMDHLAIGTLVLLGGSIVRLPCSLELCSTWQR